MRFEFTDQHGQARSFECIIRGADHQREVTSFGIEESLFWQGVNLEVEAALRAEAKARGVGRLFNIWAQDKAAVTWTPPNPDDVPENLAEEARKFASWLKKNAPRRRDEILDGAYRSHGFVLGPRVDYQRIVENATGPLADCTQALSEVVASSQGDRLTAFLAFFQELEYVHDDQIGEKDEHGRWIGGFWVPTDVLVRKAGDCDSKGAAFCAMWRQLPARSIMLFVPKHALVAVEAVPGPGQKYIPFRNRYYVLCEVVGPKKAMPGETSVSGPFQYVVIDPVASK